MSKISKFIICCLAVIISICSFVVPTYCSDVSSLFYNVVASQSFNDYSSLSDYYNRNNISQVYYDNFNLTYGDYRFLYFESTQSFTTYDWTSIGSTVSVYNNGVFVTDIGVANYEWSFSRSGNSYSFSVRNFTYEDLGYKVYLENSPNEEIGLYYGNEIVFNLLPTTLKNQLLNKTLNRVHVYRNLSISFDINYGNQYFYNNLFGIYLNNVCMFNDLVKTTNPASCVLTVNFTDNYNNIFSYRSTSLNSYVNDSFVLQNNYNFENSYVSNFYYSYGSDYTMIGNVVPNSSTNFQERFELSQNTLLSDVSSSLYIHSWNSKSINSMNSSNINGNGGVDFYKTAEWWDISSHLYNFFIYLIFDAPIISNFTNLVMVIINFIVELFDFIIGLFTGINNIFFISIFIGIIALIFLLKIIFKG